MDSLEVDNYPNDDTIVIAVIVTFITNFNVIPLRKREIFTYNDFNKMWSRQASFLLNTFSCLQGLKLY